MVYFFTQSRAGGGDESNSISGAFSFYALKTMSWNEMFCRIHYSDVSPLYLYGCGNVPGIRLKYNIIFQKMWMCGEIEAMLLPEVYIG